MLETEDAAPSEQPYVAWLLAIAVVGLLLLTVSACNTVEGVGKDLSAAGNKVSETAEDVKK
jgi:predicted small secreted protein